MTSSRRRALSGFSPLAITGVGGRLPGANNETEFWHLLDEGHCTVGPLPDRRWRPEHYFHPRPSEPGFSYTFAGGYIEDPLGFDPVVFGISPREAAEMDPQQRLLLEAVWGALEDSGIPPSAVAGSNMGVYVGASSLDYGNLYTADPAAIESHFMTGNTLSVMSNRISYIFDLRGPSFTVDTACASSLVAFTEAQSAISSGRIDMAIVAGVNLLMSPIPFIGFSRASMLSPTGLCRPFSAQADGYVRAEGALAMVLARLEIAVERGYPVRAVALASGVSSNGRTSGISLPSVEGQQNLLNRLYRDGAIEPRRLAFVEAHGTGTRVGDPAEATAIGKALGQLRGTPLPIGSVKSNIGHLEAAAGLAGLYKAILALEHRKLPRSLHLEEINPAIDFAGLNIAAAIEPVTLPPTGTWLAGVSSFGFGGTNAHVVIRQPEAAELLPRRTRGTDSRPAELLVLSAHSRPALNAMAASYADFINAAPDGVPDVASAAGWQRDLAAHRLALRLSEPARMVASLRSFAETGNIVDGVAGVAPSAPPKICFVFSGNGSQWAGMGRTAFARSHAFRQRFSAIDEIFIRLAGWSLVEALHDRALTDQLRLTRIAQPLLFAVQSALAASLDEWGLRPDMVLGHSVGEIAAAEASGAIDPTKAVHVILRRSEHQEKVHGLGRMAAVGLSRHEAETLISSSDLFELEIAAINSPTSVTVSGPEAVIRSFSQLARKRRVAVRILDLAYPFHSAILDPLRLPLLEALGDFAPRATDIPFISTVAGDFVGGSDLDADYWWRNVREPVRFRDAVEMAARQGAALFVEIGPRPILTASITDTMREAGLDGAVMPSLVEKESDGAGDPVALIAARALTMGCRLDAERLFGTRTAGRIKLPPYAWQRTPFSQPQTSEALQIYGGVARHPLIGARLISGAPEWRNLIDPTVVPYLWDHRIGNEIIVPGSAFAEMALAVAREIFPEGPIGLEDFDLLQWLPLRPNGMREISVRLSGDTQVVEIWSRARLSANEWTLHACGRIVQVVSPSPTLAPQQALAHQIAADEVYGIAAAAGVQYGPAFRRLLRATWEDNVIEVELSPVEEDAGSSSRKQTLHPIALDASFHALFHNIKLRADERHAYLPVRFARLRVDRDGAVPVRARLVVDRETDRLKTIAVALFDENNNFIASLSGGLFREVVLDRREPTGMFFHQEQVRLTRSSGGGNPREIAVAALRSDTPKVRPDSWLVLEAFARSLAYRRLRIIFGDNPVSRESIAACKTIAAVALPLIVSLFEHLVAVGLASETSEGWILAGACDLPGPSELLETFAAEYSGATAEIVLAAQALHGLESIFKSGVPLPARNTTLEQFESASILFEPVLSAARAVSDALAARIEPDPLRILVAEPSCLGLLRILTPLVHAGRATVTVIGTNAERLRHTAARCSSTQSIEFLEIADDTDQPSEPSFDLALAFAFGPVFDDDVGLGEAISRRLPPNALLCVLQPPDSAIFDVLLGGSDGWFASSLEPKYPVGRVAATQNSQPALVRSGFSAIETLSVGDGAGNILLAAADFRPTQSAFTVTRAVVVGDVSPLIAQLADVLRADGRPVQMLEAVEPAEYALTWPIVSASAAPGEIIDLIFSAFTAEHGGLDRSITHLAAILETVQMKKCRLWIVVRGLQSTAPNAVDPIAEAIWCFARVGMNEYPSVDLKLVDVALDLDEETAARHVATVIFSPGADAELLVDAVGISAIRAVSGLRRAGMASVPAVRLKLAAKGVLAKFDWVETERRQPGPSEVEIEIAAAGLNFRDIMLATGLLADDVLDDGLAGAEIGFECAGKVVRVGEDVTDLKIGDAVMGFGRQSFATYTTADARVFAVLPKGLPVEAAATIPVAFLTAWYSLVHLARLQPGELVLIHGAAGGVGLAAMQIARLRGARIVATVSSPDKRALVELFGAEMIYNSRDTAFLDAIRDEIGGVDVVLNSLAGDAMLASIKCLKAFGRFVELGKRDYVLNTAMGLRPFRRNLTYYGVDLDQLLAANLPLASRLMVELVPHFESGELCPLPYRAFAWHEAGEAFQLMQAAGHVGKLIVRPSSSPIATTMAEKLFQPGPGVHLVVGGTDGFGFETAAWLAERGAEAVVVASRRGQIEPHLRVRAEAIRARGTKLIAEVLDVTSATAVDALITRLVCSYGRLAGVIHAAMVLDDGLIAGLEPARTRAVLAPKMDGVTNLDRATNRNCAAGAGPPDYFVVYSSATTMIGNPGQAAYVAANGYLQGLMCRRRAEGLPGLAIAWGAIADVGVLARAPDIAVKLERISGIVPMRADEALSQLDIVLARPSICSPTVYCATFRPGAAPHGLKLLETPAFVRLVADAEGTDQEDSIDLAMQLAGESEPKARAIVARLVASEVARILRLSAEEIDVGRPLDQLGMDSLMSLELRMSMEKRFGIELPIVAISSGINVNDLSARLLAGLSTGGATSPSPDGEMRLIMQHGLSDVGPSDLMAVTDVIDTRRDAVVLR